MIKKVTLKVGSYKNTTTIETEKKVNLVYGLNGTGKSTLSEFFRQFKNNETEKYVNCKIEPNLEPNEEILVYNQKWIEEIFYTSPTLKGIFSLSQGNADAKKAIDAAKTEIQKNEEEFNNIKTDIDKLDLEFAKKKKNVIDSVWQVKGKYTGGDRNTDRFFSGIKANKDFLYEKVANFPKQTSAPEKDISTISKELEVLLKATGDKLPKIQSFKFQNLIDDDKKLLEKEIVGSTNSTFSTLINDLKNSDWVSKGIDYLEDQSEIAKCPFCQQNVDKNHLIQELKTCFDKSYEQDKEKLSALSNLYTQKIEEIEEDSLFTNVTFLNDLKEKYQIALQKLINSLKTNLTLIREKNQTPSKVIILHDVDNEVIAINNVIDEANELIEAFNTKIDKKDETLKELGNLFWSNIRFQYETTLNNFSQEEAIYLSKKSEYSRKQENLKKEIEKQNNIIQIESKKVSNIDDAVNNINRRLQELGIDSFKIEKYPEEEALYKLVRIDDNTDNIFDSLSEGEKMIISFLYFIEECRGKGSREESEKKRIIVIDDPISSLSHIYVFNIGTLIKDEFLTPNSKYEQIFVLTHNLYFFYELAREPSRILSKLKDEEQEKERKKEYALYRIVKNSNGSSIIPMKYSEIQNDYQMYWSVVNNPNSPSALIANCMRNIIDYFFGFIEKNALSGVFQKTEFKGNVRYQAFYRFINRESHSDNINIYDMKEFDYDSFQEAFQKVFEIAGYEDHYKKMRKIGV